MESLEEAGSIAGETEDPPLLGGLSPATLYSFSGNLLRPHVVPVTLLDYQDRSSRLLECTLLFVGPESGGGDV